ncbi:MAG: ice-binding family protein [Spirochaetes bacterium]|nr:ice-binding family protein [Spirochaetota bacterium]
MKKYIARLLIAGLMVAAIAGCTSPVVIDVTAPTVSSVVPANVATDVAVGGVVTATFSEAMDSETITDATFTLAGVAPVAGAVVLNDAGTMATFTPAANLAYSTSYTATITVGAKDLAGNALTSSYIWNFTAGATAALGPAPVALGLAGDYAILAKTAISTTGTTAITGNIGVSPAAQSFLTGFSETLDATNVFATSSLVTGKLYAADMAVPTASNLTTAVGDMQIAYTNAAGRVTPDFTNLGAGDITGLTLTPGLYNWGTSLQATSAFTISGAANDVWIFQVAGDLTIGNGVIVTLSGGAMPKNIFWQVAGQTSLGTTASFKGVILCQTQIVMQTGAVLSGRALAQTAVTMDSNAVTEATL